MIAYAGVYIIQERIISEVRCLHGGPRDWDSVNCLGEVDCSVHSALHKLRLCDYNLHAASALRGFIWRRVELNFYCPPLRRESDG